MPDISLPEVRLRDKLPEGLRNMNLDDIQKAMPEVRLPSLDIPSFDMPDLGREAQRAAKQAEKATRKAQKNAAREAAKAARAVENALPRRAGPNPVPIAILAMLGGLVVGWLLATNPATRARVSAALDGARARLADLGGGSRMGETWDTTEPVAYPESVRAPIEPEPYSETLSTAETGMIGQPGELPTGMGTSDLDEAGARDPLAPSERA